MIGTVRDNDGFINIYDEDGNYKAGIQIYPSQGERLAGYTSTTVSISDDYCTKIYDENGNLVNTLQ